MKPIFIVLIVLGVVILGCLFLAVSYVKAPPDTAYIITGPRKQRTLIGKASVGEGGGASVDLSNYYTKTEVDSLIPDASRFITEIPAEYVTETELNAKGYLTEHQSLTNYYTKAETTQAIQDALNAIGVAEGGAY